MGIDDDALSIASRLLALPTAPLAEDAPLDFIRALVAEHPALTAASDAAGNVVVRCDADDADPDRPLVLVAHLDHPGFAVKEVDGTTATLTFRGGLAAAHALPGTALEWFRPGDAATAGRGEVLVATANGAGRLTGATARVLDGHALPGGFAVWAVDDADHLSIPSERIVGRACDDLVGAAAVLVALGAVAESPPPGIAVWGLFTRAEEIGLLGALEAIRLRTVPPGAAVISVECSRALVEAPQGGGVVVRVGDRASIFNPDLTEALCIAAERLRGSDPGFAYQRRLMDGGTCEASAFCAAGYRASGMALPLGNYHNASDKGTGIAAEHVAVADYLTLVQLLAGLARSPDLLEPRGEPPAWLADRAATAQAALGAG